MFRYTVYWTTVVNPKDISVILPTGSPALTLVTCYPFYYVGSAPQRFIVRALPQGAVTTAAAAPHRPSPFGGPVVATPGPAIAQAGVSPAALLRRQDPPPAPGPPAPPRKGAIRRALSRFAGVFSPQRAKLQ
jgi:hypothetical protein